jgi:fatty-acyl-CoA synthase
MAHAKIAGETGEKRTGELLIRSIMKTAAQRYSEREAFYCTATSRRFTFRAVNERCNRLSNGLLALGLCKGDVVAVLSRNRIELLESMFALAKTGIVGLPLNYRMADAEILQLMASLNAVAIVCDAAFVAVAERAASEIPSLRQIIVFGGPTDPVSASVSRTIDYDLLLANSNADDPDIELHESDPFYFNLTSGTSGLPKCYSLTHYANASLWPLLQLTGLNANDVILTAFPMFGRVGLMWAGAGMLCGARNVLVNFEESLAAKLIEEERVTLTNLVPTMAAMLLQGEALRRHDMSSLRAVIFAGSPLPVPIREAVAQCMCASIHEYYGMQECGALVASTPEDRMRKPGSVGCALVHSEVRIVDESGQRLPPNQIGEIIGRSPGATTRYHDNAAKTAETFRDGWIYTGDLGSLDEDGYLTIHGRKKDMIVTGGQNVFAAEVEEAILACSGVRECAVIGLPDALWGERVSAVVSLLDGAQQSAESLIQHCRERLPGFKTPKQIIFITEPLPRTPTGKVQKFLLVQHYAQTQ